MLGVESARCQGKLCRKWSRVAEICREFVEACRGLSRVHRNWIVEVCRECTVTERSRTPRIVGTESNRESLSGRKVGSRAIRL
ncbi:unnamed protein product [Cochlearia groenlandica]